MNEKSGAVLAKKSSKSSQVAIEAPLTSRSRPAKDESHLKSKGEQRNSEKSFASSSITLKNGEALGKKEPQNVQAFLNRESNSKESRTAEGLGSTQRKSAAVPASDKAEKNSGQKEKFQVDALQKSQGERNQNEKMSNFTFNPNKASRNSHPIKEEPKAQRSVPKELDEETARKFENYAVEKRRNKGAALLESEETKRIEELRDCTFQPNSNSKKRTRPKSAGNHLRKVNEFFEWKTQKMMNQAVMQMEQTAKEKNTYFHPLVSPRSKQLAVSFNQRSICFICKRISRNRRKEATKMSLLS